MQPAALSARPTGNGSTRCSSIIPLNMISPVSKNDDDDDDDDDDDNGAYVGEATYRLL